MGPLVACASANLLPASGGRVAQGIVLKSHTKCARQPDGVKTAFLFLLFRDEFEPKIILDTQKLYGS